MCVEDVGGVLVSFTVSGFVAHHGAVQLLCTAGVEAFLHDTGVHVSICAFRLYDQYQDGCLL